MKKILVKVLKITLILIIFIISFILVDAFSTKFFNTRPLFAKKEKTISGITETGIVYKTLFADVYYCNSMVETYDEDDNLIRNDEVLRYYEKKNSNFICKIWINEKDDIYSKYHEQAKEKKDLDFMKKEAEGLYKSNYNKELYNSKFNTFTFNSNGYYNVSEEYNGYYIFDVNDFNKDPIKLELEGFDLRWRVVEMSYSPDGNIMVFKNFCGYRDNVAMSDQKYTPSDCEQNKSTNGIYAFKVNNINDYTYLNYISDEKLNIFSDEYPDTYFNINKIIDNQNVLLRYRVTKNKQGPLPKEEYYVWNITDNTLKEYHE